MVIYGWFLVFCIIIGISPGLFFIFSVPPFFGLILPPENCILGTFCCFQGTFGVEPWLPWWPEVMCFWFFGISREISLDVFFIFLKFWFFGLFGGLKNRKNGQKFFFGKIFFLLRMTQFPKKSCLEQFLKFWFFSLSNLPDLEIFGQKFFRKNFFYSEWLNSLKNHV